MSNNPSPETSPKGTGPAIKTENCPQESGVQSRTLPDSSGIPQAQRACWECSGPTKISKITSNKNGDKGRPYFKCENENCEAFHSYADERGVNPDNPVCKCENPSRMQVSGRGKESRRSIIYNCSTRTCAFFQKKVGPDGRPLSIGEDQRRQMREEGLI